jgi:hypothetical protein
MRTFSCTFRLIKLAAYLQREGIQLVVMFDHQASQVMSKHYALPIYPKVN